MPWAVCSITQMKHHAKDSGWLLQAVSCVCADPQFPQGKGVSRPLIHLELFLSHLTLLLLSRAFASAQRTRSVPLSMHAPPHTNIYTYRQKCTGHACM